MACSFQSLKTEVGLKELNDHLAGKSFLGGGASATQEDFEWLQKAPNAIDSEKFPHARRWCQHLRALKVNFPLRQWPRVAGSSGSKGGEGEKGKDQAKLEGLLPGAEMGKVCTRFPPEPSGYLHIGHAKAAMLNNHYARHYQGKLIVRFDDTNPSKEKLEFEESMIQDLATLEIKPDVVSHTSDHFDKLQKVMEDVIKKGMAYCDDTDVDTMRAERDKGTPSKCRDQSVEENLRRFGEMLKGSDEGVKNCVRGKMDMKNVNKCLRDPVFYRCKTDTPHHKHGFKYKAYPTYDFACPVVDALEGVTHALRTIEYKDRAPMYEWVLKATGSRHVDMVEFSKTQFSYTILSKRKLTWFVDNGYVESWADPRFPTVQGVLRRGMTVEGLKEFVLTQGMSKATNMMEWDKIWAINKQKIDPIVPRYVAVADDAAVLHLDGPAEPVGKMDKKHPKNDELGERLIMQCKDVYIEQEDAQEIAEGEQVTLLHWGNTYVDKITRDKSGKVVELTGRLNIEGNVKDTKKKIHWVGKLDEQVTPVILREFDHLVTKAKLEDDDDLPSIINSASCQETKAIGDPLLKTLPKGQKMQLERRGYYIVDQPAFQPGSLGKPGQPMVLIKIPDGKSKDMGMKSKVDPSKLQGAAGTKGDKAEKKVEDASPKKAAKDNKANEKESKEKGEKGGKAKAKAAPAKAADRPLEDISRLNIKVGKITKVWPHPDAEKLYCEEIDVGENQPRTIASGLRAHLKQEEMEGKLVIILANLKPRKMQGFESQGMVMCATSKEGKVELMEPPAGSKVGERVMVEGVDMLDPDEKLNEKTGKAPWEVLRPGCLTNGSMQGTYNGAIWTTSAGPVTCKTVANGTIS
eukprot:TRINITY_DN91734_c0_g1_i1.p1 TRINITY_DN91734_c0_g1~~TRINITY_DN91734_c0_g1_i1.p1  ORF type:complete len:858 (-),score=261.46 TRINITY_DN91734_c0_g1_i1:137-2710(-)